jgi:hypothetical protein
MTTEAPEAPTTPEAPEAPQPLNGVLFASRRTELRLVKSPRYPQYGPGGRQVGEHSGQTIPFRDGKLLVPKDAPVILEDGGKLDPDEALEYLRSHRLYDDPHGGFWEVQMTAPPVSQADLQRAMEMSARLDVDGLKAWLAEEQQGWNRPDVTGPLEQSITEITAALAKAEADAREAVEAEAKAAKAAPKKAPQ